MAHCALRAALQVGQQLLAGLAGEAVFVDDAPPGWTSDELLAQSLAIGTLIE